MAAIDILFLALVAVGAYMGFAKGIVAQIGSIAAVVIGVVAARLLGPAFTALISDDSSSLDSIAGYGVAFIAAYLAVFVIARIMKLTVHSLHLGIIDRVAGAAFKVLEWALILSLALNVYLLAAGDDAELRDPSKPWRKVTVDLAPATLGYLSDLQNHHKAQNVDNANQCENEGQE